MAAGRTLIVLEDDPGARNALCLVLSDWDFHAIGAPSAAEAMQALGAGAAGVAAIITDFDLGDGLNGVSESQALLAAGVKAPVLVISGSLGDRAARTAHAAGFEFLAKPVMPVDIRTWLDAAASAAA